MLTEEQIENRKKGIGASEAAIVLGLSQYCSPYKLWLIKTGQAQQEDLADLPQVYWGSVHEDNIASHYAKVMNCQVKPVPETLYHKDYPFVLCHLDREVVGQRKVLECKFAMYARDDWGPNGSDIVPMSYIVQVQYQLAITGYEAADLAALISGWDFRVYHFKRDEALINKILEEVCAFWKCVETNTPPSLRDRRDAELSYPFSVPNAKVAEPEIIEVVEELRDLKIKSKELEKKELKLKDKLTIFMKDAECVRTDTQILATWKNTARGSRMLKITEARI